MEECELKLYFYPSSGKKQTKQKSIRRTKRVTLRPSVLYRRLLVALQFKARTPDLSIISPNIPKKAVVDIMMLHAQQ